MSDNSFTKFVPGFEFLQGLVKNAGSALPGIGQWVAPTLNPEELSKRIEELRTVQFWLEQNARMLAATIQALEVQRMTLSTLKSMNVPLADLRDSLKLPTGGDGSPWPAIPPEILAAAAPVAQAAAKTAVKTAAKTATVAAKTAGNAAKAVADNPAAVVDPTQWWAALSQQFTQLATSAMKDTATDAAKNLAGNLVKQSFDAASETLKRAASVPGSVVGSVAKGFAAGANPKPAARTAAKTAVKTPAKTAAKTPRRRST
ncbi:PhaM family polyhydroxyalkanoate granule multifunctional regulatory protein [Roseateles sp. NT4]|uniref:PhaM family polyhydroxyalkanoate granule multifunctional regulatory protein n=1 Tax=Roseateles sp. NT4 TaxID=3453715 RepID=UPI003EE90FEF